MKLSSYALILGSVAGLAAGSAYAVTVPIFSTGVADDGSVLAGGTADSHWLVSENGQAAIHPFVTNPDAIVIQNSIWAAEAPNARWIGPNTNAQAIGPASTYRYATSFDLTGLDVSTVTITGAWASDNDSQILLNGNPTGFTVPDNAYGSLRRFDLNASSGLVAGTNILTFVVVNTDINSLLNPTGLQVVVSGSGSPIAVAVPEPATLGLLGVALAGVVWRCRRRT